MEVPTLSFAWSIHVVHDVCMHSARTQGRANTPYVVITGYWVQLQIIIVNTSTGTALF